MHIFAITRTLKNHPPVSLPQSSFVCLLVALSLLFTASLHALGFDAIRDLEKKNEERNKKVEKEQEKLTGEPAENQTTANSDRTFKFSAEGVLGTSFNLTVIAEDKQAAAEAEKACLNEIDRLTKIFSHYDDDSEVSKFNRSEGTVTISEDLMEVLTIAQEIQKKTGSAFNIQIEPLLETWNQAYEAEKLPSQADIAKGVRNAKRTGFVIQSSTQVRKLADTKLRLDAMGKGYILDKAAGKALEASPKIDAVLVDIGGDVASRQREGLTNPPTWKIAITDPSKPADNEKPLAVIDLPSGLAVASSGHYARFHTIEGKQYSHIIDPRVGQPVDHVAGATVIARQAVLADAWATALCVLKPQQSLAMSRTTAMQDLEFLVVVPEGKPIMTPGATKLVQVGNTDEATETDADQANIVEVTFVLPRQRPRPYVAVWIEDASGNHVRTLEVWGDHRKYQRDLRAWYQKIGRDREMLDAVSRATRPAGTYTLTWDGKDHDDKSVKPGDYVVHVEVVREDAGREHETIKINTTRTGEAGTAQGDKELGKVSVTIKTDR